MPIYEYRCDSCGHQQEFLQRMSDAPLKVCPKCGKPKLTKLLSAAGFQLKGTGWYVTDFRDGKSKSAAATGGKTEKAADATKPADSAKSSEGAAKETPKPAATSAKPSSGSAGETKS
jgi:putative FmdB family regulatory protein